MDFRDTPGQASFRKEVRSWLEAELPQIRDALAIADATERMVVLRDWQRTMARAGWVGIAWPEEYGGRGASLVEQAIFNEEFARAQAPGVIGSIGVAMAGPTIMAVGTDPQKARYLPKILTAEEIWCQGFSEPGAGSDLAGLTTMAVEDGDEFVVNGQKVWTSFGHIADFCLLMTRTQSGSSKHAGLTYFVMDMHSPGIDVRPLRQMTGDSEFNEVFLTDVRIPRDQVLGEVGQGWRVAMTTLSHERGTAGFLWITEAVSGLNGLFDLARRQPRGGATAFDDPLIRQRLGQLHVDLEQLRLTALRSLSTAARTGEPGPEGSLTKLGWSETKQRLAELAMDIIGPEGLLAGRHGEYDALQHEYLRTRANTIEGGTSEVLRNIIAERVLGLPKHK